MKIHKQLLKSITKLRTKFIQTCNSFFENKTIAEKKNYSPIDAFCILR
jgi:hypothetical protein